jgi:hypothetical protein
VVAVAAAVGAGATVTGVALASAGSHTLHLTTNRLQFVNTTSSTFVETDAVFKSARKVGYETISCDDGGHQIVCSMTVALKGGVLLGHLTIPITSNATTKVSGKLTGGLGTYSGDKGKITGSITGKHSAFTITYHG